MISRNITTITPSDVQQNLQSDGLDTLGLTTLALSTRWANATPAPTDYDANNLTLTIAALHAPYRGILDFAFSPVSSTLAADLTDSDTQLGVQVGDGDNFPSPVPVSNPPFGGSILLTLTNAAGTKMEVVECTARNGDLFTINRAASDTTAQSFTAGDKVSLRLKASGRTQSFVGADGNVCGLSTAPCGYLAIRNTHERSLCRWWQSSDPAGAVVYGGAQRAGIFVSPLV